MKRNVWRAVIEVRPIPERSEFYHLPLLFQSLDGVLRGQSKMFLPLPILQLAP